MSKKRTIEIFTAGCPLCNETVAAVKNAVASCGCEVIERSVSSESAKNYGVRAVPTVVIDGQIAFERRPTDEEIASLTLTV
ncbi:MAG: thioredoxin family protein [Blastocatellia bacterium]|nr:thioredoxin family protein [Blastocatellia bacterium]